MNKPENHAPDIDDTIESVELLRAGRCVTLRPTGPSMQGRIESGELVTVAPVKPAEVAVDDIVLVEWKRGYLLHLVKEIRDGEWLIGNNHGKINGWVPFDALCGKVVSVKRYAE